MTTSPRYVTRKSGGYVTVVDKHEAKEILRIADHWEKTAQEYCAYLNKVVEDEVVALATITLKALEG